MIRSVDRQPLRLPGRNRHVEVARLGGDTFDYCLGRDVLHLSVTDAMGHGVASALNATLCVGSLRNTRRRGGSLLDQAAAANRALFEHAASTGAEGFATGLLGRLDLRTGIVSTSPSDVLDGDLDPFMAAALSQRVTGEVAEVEDVD